MEIPPNKSGPSHTAFHRAIAALSTDVIAVQEIDFNLPRSGSINQIAEVAQVMGAQSWAFAPSIVGTPGEKWEKLSKGDIKIFTNETVGSLAGSYGIGIASTVKVLKWHR